MKSSKPLLIAVAVSLIGAGIAAAARVDFSDPRRALGRDGDIRVDAELSQEGVSANSPLSVTYQIENLSKATIAIADRIADTDFDAESQTVTLSIGAEVPPGRQMPHLVTINPGQKRVLTGGALLHVVVPNVRTRWTIVPRFVQVKVTVLRDVAAFAQLIEQQNRNSVPVALPNNMFDRWVEASDSIFLNAIPVYWNGDSNRGDAANDRPAGTQ